MNIDTLVQLGFSQSEADVFAVIVAHDPCHVAQIVRDTQKHRQTIYNALIRLEEENLVNVSQKNGKNLYAVGDPHALLLEIQQKEVLAKEFSEGLEKAVDRTREHVEVFPGANTYVDAMASFRYHAEAAKEFIIFGGQGDEWFSFTNKVFDDHVTELRRMRQCGVEIITLYFEEEWKSAEKLFRPYVGDPYTVKVLSGKCALPHTVWIAGDHLYILTPVADPIVVHITSKELAKKYHEYFWDTWVRAQIVQKKC